MFLVVLTRSVRLTLLIIVAQREMHKTIYKVNDLRSQRIRIIGSVCILEVLICVDERAS